MKRIVSSFSSFAIIVGLVVALMINNAQSKEDRDIKDDSPSYQSYNSLIDSVNILMKKYSFPGVAIALVSKDSILMTECIGFANSESNVPITDSTLFCVGSCTKSFLGLAFLKLVDDGKIDVAKPIREIVPEIEFHNPWEKTNPVRIIHLLEHTSGFDDIHPNALYNEQNIEMPLYEALQMRPNSRTVRWRSGTMYSYSSPGYTVAGYILEKLTDKKYEDFIKESILEPIGMMKSTLRLTDDSRRLLAVGYGDNLKPLPYIQGFDRPSASLNSSITDMANFVRFLINDGKVDGNQLISKSSIDLIGKPTTTLAANAGLADGYSFGIGIRFQDGLKWYGHSGGGPGFTAKYSYLKDHRLGYVVMSNYFNPQQFQELCRVVQSNLIKGITPELKPSIQVSNDQLQEYVGYYELQNSRMQLTKFLDILFNGVTIAFENDTLYESEFMTDKKALIGVSKNKFKKIDDADASRIFITNSGQGIIYATGGSFYVKAWRGIPYIYRSLFFGALFFMLSAIIYAFVWIPVYLYKKIRKSDKISPYLRMRVVPLIAVLSLVISIYLVSTQELMNIGQKTFTNIAFSVLTFVFGGISVLSIWIAIKSLFKPIRIFAKLYCLLLSTSCFGMTLFLGYWGIIGLRLWAY